MKITIENFKSISSLVEYNIKPMTILSGVNSTGKSSFIQLLLLLKQTIDLESQNHQLLLDGDYYQVRDFTDIVKNKNEKNKLRIGFLFAKDEFHNNPRRITLFDSLSTYDCEISFSYSIVNHRHFIDEFTVKYLLPEGNKKEQFVHFYCKYKGTKDFKIETNNELFVKNLWINPEVTISDIDFISIFPTSYEISEIIEEQGRKGEAIGELRTERFFVNLEGIRNQVDSFFKSISYVGPLREVPMDVYSIKGRHESVGIKGEFVAEILERYKEEPIGYYKPSFNEEGIEYKFTHETLLDAVSFWLCDVMELGKSIKSQKVEENYTIIVTRNSGLQTTIKHVGFGISQILPIIVEGLRMSEGSTLILEQPEIHLHPKIQSLLFDFLYGLTLNGVKVIIETHSDHFITRLRRRLAEEKSGNMKLSINLTFIEGVQDEILFRTLSLDDLGSLDYFPKDFIEQNGIEMKAILKAQLRKTRTQK